MPHSRRLCPLVPAGSCRGLGAEGTGYGARPATEQPKPVAAASEGNTRLSGTPGYRSEAEKDQHLFARFSDGTRRGAVTLASCIASGKTSRQQHFYFAVPPHAGPLKVWDRTCPHANCLPVRPFCHNTTICPCHPTATAECAKATTSACMGHTNPGPPRVCLELTLVHGGTYECQSGRVLFSFYVFAPAQRIPKNASTAELGHANDRSGWSVITKSKEPPLLFCVPSDVLFALAVASNCKDSGHVAQVRSVL